MHSIQETFNNIAHTSFNPSCGITDANGDDKGVDPNLPEQPGAPGIGDGDGGGNAPPQGSGDVYISPGVWDNGQMQCFDPAVIVLPPYRLPQVTTINIPPYTTSFQVGGATTTVTITVAPITTSVVPVYNVPIFPGNPNPSVVQPFPSIDFPPVGVPLNNGGTTTTRTVVLPPWPFITMGPPESWTRDPDLPRNPGAPEETTSSGIPIGGFPGTTAPPPVETNPDPPPGPPPSKSWDWNRYPAQIKPDPPIRDKDNDDDEDDDHGVVVLPCNVWFFNVRSHAK